LGLARAEGLEADAWEKRGIIVERGHLMLVEHPLAQRLDAQGHILDVFGALGRCNDDFVLCGGRRLSRGDPAEGGGRHQRCDEQRKAGPRPLAARRYFRLHSIPLYSLLS
jgi:hypothetical protein